MELLQDTLCNERMNLTFMGQCIVMYS